MEEITGEEVFEIALLVWDLSIRITHVQYYTFIHFLTCVDLKLLNGRAVSEHCPESQMNRVAMATLLFFLTAPFLGDVQGVSATGPVGTVSGRAVLGRFRGTPALCVGNRRSELCQRNPLRSLSLYRGHPHRNLYSGNVRKQHRR